MIIEYNRASAFICPFCSRVTTRKLTPFSFSGRKSIKYICSTKGCREECGRTFVKSGGYLTEIECPICGELHSFSTKYNNFWYNANIIYKCPNSDVSIFFMGSDEKAKEYPEKMMKEYKESFDFFEGETEITELLLDMMDCLTKLDMKKKIYCTCGSKDISYTVEMGDINLTCGRCGRSRAIEINEENLKMLLNAEAVIIEN